MTFDINEIDTHYTMIFGERMRCRGEVAELLEPCTSLDDIEELLDADKITLGEYDAITSSILEPLC